MYAMERFTALLNSFPWVVPLEDDMSLEIHNLLFY
jgi:hypothetical protein